MLEEKDRSAWLVLKDGTAVIEARQRIQNLELSNEPPEVVPEKAGLEPKIVRFEPVLIILRLRVKLRMRLRMDRLKMGGTGGLQRSFPHLADE